MRSISKKVLLRLVAQSDEADICGDYKTAESITKQLTKLAIRSDDQKYSYMKDELVADIKEILWEAVTRIMDYYDEVPDAREMDQLVDFEAVNLVDSVEGFIQSNVGKYEEEVPGEEVEETEVEEAEKEVEEE